MKKRVVMFLTLILAVSVCIALVSCGQTNPQVSSSGAKQIAANDMYKVPKNSKGRTTEQQNIDDRIRVTTDPTKIMWIHLISLDGKIIKRMPVRNKVTSSGKRLEPKVAADANGSYPDATIQSANSSWNFETNEFIQPDGTFGDSDPYIFWFDPMGRYHQWGTAGGLGYLLTDYPIDLSDPISEVTGLYNVHRAALQWQQEQEKNLKQQEGK